MTTLVCRILYTDFRIPEPRPFAKKWWSFKFNGPGLRYEIALEVMSGHIVWAHGGFPCGRYPDLKIAREKFVKLLHPKERAVADKGYRFDSRFICAKNGQATNKRIKNILVCRRTESRNPNPFCKAADRRLCGRSVTLQKGLGFRAINLKFFWLGLGLGYIMVCDVTLLCLKLRSVIVINSVGIGTS